MGETIDLLSMLAFASCILGTIPYVLAILKKEARPEKATWIIWAVLDTIVLAGMYATDAINGQITGTVISVCAVAVLALKYGVPGWTRLDKFCLGGAALGIALWLIADNPLLGIAISLSVALVGSVPTFASAWEDPSRENKLAWIVFWIGSICQMAAISCWTFEDAAQPIVFLAIQTTIVYIVHVRSRYLERKNAAYSI